MTNKSVVVTGGSGKAGRAVIRELLAHGYAVMNVDLATRRAIAGAGLSRT